MAESVELAAVHEAGHATAALALGADLESLWVAAAAAGGGFYGRTTQARGRDVETMERFAFVTLAGPCAEALARKAVGGTPGRIRGTDLDHLREQLAKAPHLDRLALEHAVFGWLVLPEVREAVLRVARRVVALFGEEGVARVQLAGREVAALVGTLPPPPGLVA